MSRQLPIWHAASMRNANSVIFCGIPSEGVRQQLCSEFICSLHLFAPSVIGRVAGIDDE